PLPSSSMPVHVRTERRKVVLVRILRVVIQIDAGLPAGGRGLHEYVRIENPNAEPVPMYWWSNAAVEQRPDLRVLAPADRAYATGYDGTVGEVPVPVAEDRSEEHTSALQSRFD